MIMKKVCMLGAFAVGKTSLVQRFVHGIFSDDYLTTLGVKIDQAQVRVGPRDLRLILWDLAGEDEFIKVRMSYLRGSAGLLLVVDATRPDTLETALRLHGESRAAVGDLPYLLLLNKSDLEMRLDEASLAGLRAQGVRILATSAKTGEGVRAAFADLAEVMAEVH